MKTAIFAAGCFWGVQYYFDQVPGVISTEVGYIGGEKQNPTYEDVCYRDTHHAEAVKITYDPVLVVAGGLNASTMHGADEQQTEPYDGTVKGVAQSATKQRAASSNREGGYADLQVAAFQVLLKQFFRMHDPTQLDRQGPDIGDQYRSAIFYVDDTQKTQAEQFMSELKNDSHIVTTVEPVTTFWPAEEYHQKYTQKTGRGMCHIPYKSV
jgi:peptide methionine sulfoxide reductase MsrA